ncbi:2Fe-2S iron-sulfur cluster-binding protein [Candidatus Parcubacteria bacterium]|nr:(2Fe-2S)-binding protein [Patescibacteria group bacterium]MBU4309081.1 (2Fe-2S)-binding protein [Patescibacteria group bacterium]MBU4432458.1 (2Fe-2S)-binding protein [Patescibacteria group bacterium]MBU4577442.1 (2Fe-2S)-binding protein [Patescibacteria group bacterium]MCG2697130.1 2Fe-2S iron-sulfur cluster-binding protein [Candidatus Parcubacteria bacterium]
MINKIKLKINNQKMTGTEGETILEVAERNGIEIPTLCHHKDFCAKGNCRVCVVEVKGNNKLVTSCSTKASAGMEIMTESDKIKKVRNVNIELIYAEHVEKCATCVWRFECKLLEFAQKYQTKIVRFTDRKKNRQIHKLKNALEIDGTQCIDCRNCISACQDLQKLDCLVMRGKGHGQEVDFKDSKKNPCILCGQCALHCPVSAIQEQTNYEDLEREIKDKQKTVVVILDPIMELSIGENFDMKNIELNSVAAALKQMGVNYVFNSALGVEINAHLQSEHILENNGGEVMIGSHCPATVNYIKQYQPALAKNLQKIKSPAMVMGGLIKTYWADKQKLDPEKISVISIGVCVARKNEIVEKKMQFNGLWPVDYVLTLRELSFLLKKHKLDLTKSKIKNIDSLNNELADLFSTSVFASILGRLKLANQITKVDGKQNIHNLDEVLLLQNESGKELASLKGIGEVNKIINHLEKYSYLEIMSCPDGCLGGGGQPIPTTKELRKKRKHAFLAKKLPKNFNQKKLDGQIVDILEWLESNNLVNKILFS